MKVFLHHVYEYKKGIRNLILHTMNNEQIDRIREVLEQNNIAYLIQEISENKINVLFGDAICIKVFEKFGGKSLTNLTDEEDFILGIMLGYDRAKQCERYLERRNKNRIKKYNLILN